MFDILIERFRQKKRTVAYPKSMPALPPRFRGRPVIDAARCDGANGSGCTACADACPVAAIRRTEDGPLLDTGVCTFCGVCALACARAARRQALFFTTDWRLASTSREGLLVRPTDMSGLWNLLNDEPEAKNTDAIALSLPLPQPWHGTKSAAPPCLPLDALPPPEVTPYSNCAVFRRSFRLRQISAAGCGACEADLNVLGTVVFDLGRFGIDFVASPRHADALVITGPVPRNMREGLAHCDKATPRPRAVIAVGACAISGGLYRALPGSAADQNDEGADGLLPVDLYIPGCPPHPYTNLDGMLRFLGIAAYGG